MPSHPDGSHGSHEPKFQNKKKKKGSPVFEALSRIRERRVGQELVADEIDKLRSGGAVRK